jgi:hypothetical protein
MSKVCISIMMDNSAPQPAEKIVTIEDRVNEWIEDVESGRDSRLQWDKLRILFNKLATAKSLSARGIRLLRMIEPTMQKYGKDDSDGVKLAASYPYERSEEYK